VIPAPVVLSRPAQTEQAAETTGGAGQAGAVVEPRPAMLVIDDSSRWPCEDAVRSPPVSVAEAEGPGRTERPSWSRICRSGHRGQVGQG